MEEKIQKLKEIMIDFESHIRRERTKHSERDTQADYTDIWYEINTSTVKYWIDIINNEINKPI